jgi:hypothetical protein
MAIPATRNKQAVPLPLLVAGAKRGEFEQTESSLGRSRKRAGEIILLSMIHTVGAGAAEGR